MNKNKLGITEFSVLRGPFCLKCPVRQFTRIGKSILISSGSMTYVIDKLEQKGLLSRSPCHDDRRVIHITLTNDGINLMKKVMPIRYQEMINNMFGSLTDDDAQTMVNLLKKVNK